MKDSVVHQYHQSAILLETNGKGFSDRRTKHINIMYFFESNSVSAGEMSVKYCLTGDMVRNFFTKPLKGVPLRRF